MTFNTYLYYWTPELYETDREYSILTKRTSNIRLISKACWTLRRNKPNIVRVLYGGSDQGPHLFRLDQFDCTQQQSVGPIKGSMTREKTGPFYMFEPVIVGGRPYFADLRIPERVLGVLTNATVKMRDEKINPAIPGTRGRLEINGGGALAINGISLHAWTTVTFVISLSMISVDQSDIINLTTGNSSIYISVKRQGNTEAIVQAYNRVGPDYYKPRVFENKVSLNKPILFAMTKSPQSNSWYIFMYDYEKAKTFGAFSNSNRVELQTHNFTPSISAAPLVIGDIQSKHQGSSIPMTVSWVHFFNAPLTPELIRRDALNDWKVSLTNQDN